MDVQDAVNPLITDQAIAVEWYINQTWPLFETSLEVPLRNLFPEPDNRGLKHIWKHGSADVVVRRNGKIVCIIEPGGSQHFTDDKQVKNDKRKYVLCKQHGVRCLHLMNGVVNGLSSRQWRKLLGSALFQPIS